MWLFHTWDSTKCTRCPSRTSKNSIQEYNVNSVLPTRSTLNFRKFGSDEVIVRYFPSFFSLTIWMSRSTVSVTGVISLVKNPFSCFFVEKKTTDFPWKISTKWTCEIYVARNIDRFRMEWYRTKIKCSNKRKIRQKKDELNAKQQVTLSLSIFATHNSLLRYPISGNNTCTEMITEYFHIPNIYMWKVLLCVK